MPLDLANSANWQNLWTVNATAAPGASPWLHVPIPEQIVGVLASSPLLAIYPWFNPEPNTSQSRWRFAGFAVQKYQLGITGNPAPTDEAGIWRKLWLNQIQFVAFENWQVPYGLSLQVPRWFRNWRCSIWEFTGVIPDEINLLQNIQTNAQTNLAVLRSELSGSDVKLDQLLSQLDIIESKIDNL